MLRSAFKVGTVTILLFEFARLESAFLQAFADPELQQKDEAL
jgi:hypothetical protein